MTSGTHAPGTTDIYTITYTDATTSTFSVYNGANGTGAIVSVTGTMVDNTDPANPVILSDSTKANNSAVVHNTGNETVAGVKTFSSSPVVPTPTLSTQAVNKDYTDTALGLKQIVFTGMCQEQYLTENDIVIDCVSATPSLTIATVKNGQTISASNPICFFTDGSGIPVKHEIPNAVSVNFTYTT